MVLAIPSQDLRERLSYRKLYELFEHVQKTCAHKPIVIISDELCNNPERVMAHMCSMLSIPFLVDKLTWKPLSENFTGREEWHAAAQSSSLHYWHAEALQSAGFHAPKEYATPGDSENLFSVIDDPALRTMYCELYVENLQFYHKFLEIFHEQIAR